MWVLIREASGARNLRDLLPLVKEYGPYRMAFCTDDREPEHIADEGHVNSMVRVAVEEGVSPEDALVMATLNPSTWHGLREHGAVAPGYRADLLLLPDLERFVPELVLKGGRPIGEITRPEVPEWVKQTVRLPHVSASDFALPEIAGEARVIGVVRDQIVTEALTAATALPRPRTATSPRSRSSSATSAPAGSASGSSRASASAAARSRRRSPTTRTTSWSWAWTTTTSPARSRGWPSSAAARWSWTTSA